MQHSTIRNDRHSYRLFARPSFFEGWARLIDFGTTLNTYSDSPSDTAADLQALASDWRAVGDDLVTALHRYDRITQRGTV